MQSNNSLKSPPKATLAFRTGIVGHRPNRLKNANINQLNKILYSILQTVKQEVVSFSMSHAEYFDSSSPVLRAISPLAEGSDRFFALQAINLGFELCCVMPFKKQEFENDFSTANALEENSLENFHHLLDRAEKETKLTSFELDGSRVNQNTAYGAGGRVVLNQSDILIVVWDGEHQRKIGGTEETFNLAMKQGIPVIWIDAYSPHQWQILKPGASLPERDENGRIPPKRSDTLENVKFLVNSMLDLPSFDKTGDAKEHFTQFFQEKQPNISFAFFWKAFRDIFGDLNPPNVSITVLPFEDSVTEDWPKKESTPFDKTVNFLRPFYAWPDKLAVIYSNNYRSAFILLFFLAAIAVGMALAPVGFSLALHSVEETFAILMELLIIISILTMVIAGKKKRWHERWIDYRLIAELVRHLRLVASLGGERPFPQEPAHHSVYGQPGSSWMSWYVRTVERDLGLPNVVVNKNHLMNCLSDLLIQIKDKERGQIGYHRNNAERCKNIEHRLHSSGIFFLYMTLAACSLHLLPGIFHFIHYPIWFSYLLTACCGFFLSHWCCPCRYKQPRRI